MLDTGFTMLFSKLSLKNTNVGQLVREHIRLMSPSVPIVKFQSCILCRVRNFVNGKPNSNVYS